MEKWMIFTLQHVQHSHHDFLHDACLKMEIRRNDLKLIGYSFLMWTNQVAHDGRRNALQNYIVNFSSPSNIINNPIINMYEAVIFGKANGKRNCGTKCLQPIFKLSMSMTSRLLE
uniref:Uncharacterized protein n=1 Tax=Onchocerca volvulus TaxID=6282 RepID=A0A8R1TM69_ONCVO